MSNSDRRVSWRWFLGVSAIALTGSPSWVLGQVGDGRHYYGVVGGQLPSQGLSYEAALLNRLRLGIERPTDAANLSRLMTLEAISMQAHARGLGNSPAESRLSDQIGGVLQASSAYDQAVSGSSVLPVGAIPDNPLGELNAAFGQLNSELGTLPGMSPLAGYRLARVQGLLSALDQRVGPAAPTVSVAPAVSSLGAYPEVRGELLLMNRRLRELLVALKPAAGGAPKTSAALSDRAMNLLALVLGLDRFLAGSPRFEDVRLTYEPLRFRASQFNTAMLRGAPPVQARSRWREIHEGLNRLSEQFGFTRLISLAPESRPVSLPSREVITRVDESVAEFDAMLSEAAAATEGLGNDAQIRGEAYRLRVLLYRYRQDFVAGFREAAAARSLQSLGQAARQLASRVKVRGGHRQDRTIARLSDVDRIVNDLRRELPSAPTPSAK